jgi:hypothetical protein
MPSSPEDRLMKALWGKPEVMWDRRKPESRRAAWRGGRRASDWPDTFAKAEKRAQSRAKWLKQLM